MEPNLTLIAKGLAPLLAPVSRQVGKHLIGQEILERWKLNETALQPILQKAANLILDDLIEGCEEALQIAIDQGRLSAHEAKLAFRHQIVRDEIATIQKTLNLLTAPQKPDIKAILTFEENYRKHVGVA